MIGAVSPHPATSPARRRGGAAVATLLLAALCGAAPPARAEEPDPDAWPRPSLAQLQIGGALSWRPTYPGSDRMGWGLRPVVALQWGRLRLSSSQANLIESPADGSRTAGASLSLLDTPAWSSGVALRWDNGRDGGGDPRLFGLPPVPSTLRARAYLRHGLEAPADERRSVSLTVSGDLANRRGGMTLALDGGRSLALTPEWRWTQSLGVSAADATYLRSHHGVPAGSASPLPVWQPGGGWLDLHASTGLTWRLHRHWRVGGTVSVQHLLGGAADSPLTVRRTGAGLVLGLVYIAGPD